MKNSLKRWFNAFLEILNYPSIRSLQQLQEQTNTSLRQSEVSLLLLAGMKIQTQKTHPHLLFSESEFRVFSQGGEDGLIQYLIDRVPLLNKSFVEFGVEDYMEANTRFLLQNDNWSGLIIDGGRANVEKITRDPNYWRHDLTALCEFITRDNINELIGRRFRGEIDLLSIDIDGNDYWVWQALDIVSPRIVICEYNSVFGVNRAVTVPYDPNFRRRDAHYSSLYFGASLPAFCDLAEKKGYVFVGCSRAGINAFFVRKNVAQNVTSLSPEKGYVLSMVRESRDQSGQLTYLSGKERQAIISEMKVFDIREERLVKLSEC
jgi:hypothetical protein